MKTWCRILLAIGGTQFLSGCFGIYVSIHGNGVRADQRPEFAEVIGDGKSVVLKRTAYATRDGKEAEDTRKDVFRVSYFRNVTDRDCDIPAYQDVLPKARLPRFLIEAISESAGRAT